jgi:signal transduction histidine kinase
MSSIRRDLYERALREEETLRRVVEEISSELELRPLLTRIVHHACELLEADDGSIGLYDARRKVFRTEAVCRMPARELGAENAAGSGLAGAVLASGEPVVARRYGDLPGATLTELAGNAVIGVPIHGRDGLIGFFGLGAPAPRIFDERDVRTLQLLARHAAIAIDNAMRYRREQLRSERMALIARVSRLVSTGMEPTELVATAAQVIHEQLGYPNVVIPLLERGEPDQLVYRAHAGAYRDVFREEYRLPIDRGLTGAAVRERTVQVANDVRADPRYVPPPLPIDVECELAAPIVLGHEVFGVVNIEGRAPFDAEDVSSIRIIADHLAVAIKNAQLFEEAREAAIMRERQRLARDLHDSVSQALSSISLMAQSLAAAWRKDAAEGERRARRLEELSRLAFAEMRALMHELQPVRLGGPQPHEAASSAIEAVRRHGLKRALQNLAAVLAPESPEIRFEFERYRPQVLEHEEGLFRICQEALANALRHANARLVVMRAEAGEEGRVRVEVRDDGDGFAPRAARERRNARRAGGYGLTNMRERALGLGGTARVDSEPGRGTTVSIELARRDR